jgi:hypothetical protein
MKVAALLLGVWYFAHYLWQWAPEEHQGTVFNISRSAASLVLLGIIVLAFQSKPVFLAAAGVAGEEVQVVACGTWWLFDPWPIKPGDELCSSGLGVPLGSIGLVLIGMLACYLLRGGHAASR